MAENSLTFDTEDLKYTLEELERIQDSANGIGLLISCEIEVFIGDQNFVAKFGEDGAQWRLTLK